VCPERCEGGQAFPALVEGLSSGCGAPRRPLASPRPREQSQERQGAAADPPANFHAENDQGAAPSLPQFRVGSVLAGDPVQGEARLMVSRLKSRRATCDATQAPASLQLRAAARSRGPAWRAARPHGRRPSDGRRTHPSVLDRGSAAGREGGASGVCGVRRTMIRYSASGTRVSALVGRSGWQRAASKALDPRVIETLFNDIDPRLGCCCCHKLAMQRAAPSRPSHLEHVGLGVELATPHLPPAVSPMLGLRSLRSAGSGQLVPLLACWGVCRSPLRPAAGGGGRRVHPVGVRAERAHELQYRRRGVVARQIPAPKPPMRSGSWARQ